MSESFPCPRCGKRLAVPPGGRGRAGRCPSCRSPVAAPIEPEYELPTHAEPAPPSPTRSGGPASVPEGTPEEAYDFLAPPEGPGELGRLGPYVVRSVLGTGGMGVVFRAEDPALRRPVALKALLPSVAASRSHRQRFLREARAVAGIDHDHVVTIFQVGEDRGIPYLAMQLLEGETLLSRCKRQAVLPVADAVRVGREVALGLAAAHARGVVHRDVKPGNVWLEARPSTPGATRVGPPGWRVKLLDFGLARATGDGGEDITQAGTVVGTPAYMSPEQAAGGPLDARTDLFSLGVVLCQVLTGEVPFRGADTRETLAALGRNTLAAVHAMSRVAPPELAGLIGRMLNRDPAGRPASAADFLAELAVIPLPADADRPSFILVAADDPAPVSVARLKTPAPPPSRRKERTLVLDLPDPELERPPVLRGPSVPPVVLLLAGTAAVALVTLSLVLMLRRDRPAPIRPAVAPDAPFVEPGRQLDLPEVRDPDDKRKRRPGAF